MAGRGAWSKVGKDNGSVYYEFITGKPADGSTPDKSLAHGAVNLGVRAIQARINEEGYQPALTVDGVLGPKSQAAIKWYQAKQGLTADGKLGASTARRMWRKPLQAAATASGIDPKILYGKMIHESSGDPAACGFVNEPDRGLCQINTAVHKDVSLAQAHDPKYNLNYTANRFKQALDKYKGKGAKLQLECAILQHNNPAGADSLYRTGNYPSQTARDYVSDVLQDAEGWED